MYFLSQEEHEGSGRCYYCCMENPQREDHIVTGTAAANMVTASCGQANNMERSDTGDASSDVTLFVLEFDRRVATSGELPTNSYPDPNPEAVETFEFDLRGHTAEDGNKRQEHCVTFVSKSGTMARPGQHHEIDFTSGDHFGASRTGSMISFRR